MLMRIIIARSQESYHEDEIEGDPEDADEVSHLPVVNLVLLLISFACLPMPGCCSWLAMLPLFLTMDQRSSGQGACVCFGGFLDGEWLGLWMVNDRGPLFL